MNYFDTLWSALKNRVLLSKLGFLERRSKKEYTSLKLLLDCTMLCLFSTGGVAPIRFQPVAVRLYRPANPLAAKRLESNNHPERKISFKCKQEKNFRIVKLLYKIRIWSEVSYITTSILLIFFFLPTIGKNNLLYCILIFILLKLIFPFKYIYLYINSDFQYLCV